MYYVFLSEYFDSKISQTKKGTKTTKCKISLKIHTISFTFVVKDKVYPGTKIVISDVHYSDALGISKNAMYAILNILNPFKMRVPLDDVNTMTIYMRDFRIENDEINFAGVLLLPKSL